MDLKKTYRNVFAVITVLIFILSSEAVTGQVIYKESPIAKAADSTFHIHDEVEANKFFQKKSNTRKKYLAQASSMVV